MINFEYFLPHTPYFPMFTALKLLDPPRTSWETSVCVAVRGYNIQKLFKRLFVAISLPSSLLPEVRAI